MFKATALACLLMTSTSVAAASCSVAGSCNVPVSFIGSYLERTCDVDVNNGGSSASVQLPTVSARSLQTNGDEAGSTQFPIALRNCPRNHTVEMYFVTSSGSDATTGNLFNASGADYANAVQIRLRKAAGSQLRFDDNNSFQEYIINATGDDVTQYFIASYYAKGNGMVDAGNVQALSTINLIYK